MKKIELEKMENVLFYWDWFVADIYLEVSRSTMFMR